MVGNIQFEKQNEFIFQCTELCSMKIYKRFKTYIADCPTEGCKQKLRQLKLVGGLDGRLNSWMAVLYTTKTPSVDPNHKY